MTDESILEVTDATKTFGGILALNRVSFSVKQGEILEIIGPNGSGKSTALKLVAGITKPTTGQVEVQGRVSALIELLETQGYRGMVQLELSLARGATLLLSLAGFLGLVLLFAGIYRVLPVIRVSLRRALIGLPLILCYAASRRREALALDYCWFGLAYLFSKYC